MISSRTGDTIVVKGDDGTATKVQITDQTDTKDDTGLFGLGKKHMDSTVLIPGLKVKVDGSQGDNGNFVASVITVDGDDLETAAMIQAGLNPTAEQVQENMKNLEAHAEKIGLNKDQIAANRQKIADHDQAIASNRAGVEENMKNIAANANRFSTLDDYDVKGETNVKFKVGSSKLDSADEDQLKQLAAQAQGLKGVLVEITGFADSTGSAAMNTELSQKRADEVITYLVQQCNIPRRLIAAPGAMGEFGAAAPNETKEGRAENRRVNVKLLVNKGISGGSGL
ncbi:MAG TPA: OmpA family protein [Terracidiphilus sp.]|nr:OmpA family protein [Terracidiphilus sp.]